MKIDRNTPVPLYYQLKQYFLEQINSGAFGVGDRLPSEEEVIDESGLSRFTVRQAFSALEREGLVERTRGKGTFVKAPTVPMSLAWHLEGFTDNMCKMGRSVSSEVVEISLRPCSTEEAVRHLGLKIEDMVVHINRLRRVDDFPFMWESVSLPAEMVPGMEQLNLADASLLDVLRKRYSIEIRRSHRTLRIGPANPAATGFFGIKDGTQAFIMTDLAFTDNDEPLFFARAEINPKRSQFEFDLHRDANIGTGGDVNHSAHPVLRDE